MQYAISILYKYAISELCILLYPFGLHRLTAQPHQSRSTGHGNTWPGYAQTAPERTKHQHSSGHGRRDTETTPAAEPPQRSKPAAERQKSQSQHDGSSGDKTAQQTPSPTRAAEIEPEPESQKRGTVDHERRRRQRERKERKEERERRENDSKTPLFSQSHRTPSRSTARASQAPADIDNSRSTAFFRFCFCGVCGINGDQRQF